MKWSALSPWKWRRKFAWLPVRIDTHWVWLEHYEARLGGGGWSEEVRLGRG